MENNKNNVIRDAKGTGKIGQLVIPNSILLAGGPFDRVKAFKEFINDFKVVVNKPIKWAILNTDPQVMTAYVIICEIGKSPVNGADMYAIVSAVEYTATSLFGFRYIQGKGTEIKRKFYTDLLNNSFKIGKNRFEEFIKSLVLFNITDMGKFVQMTEEEQSKVTSHMSVDPNDDDYFLKPHCVSEFLRNIMLLQIESDEMNKSRKK